MLKDRNTVAVPRATKPLVTKIMSRVTGSLSVISSERTDCMPWTGETNRGIPSMCIHGQRYRIQLLLHCWYERRKAYPRRCRFQRDSRCYDRRCVNPYHIVSSSLPSDPLFVHPIPVPCQKKKERAPYADEMSLSATMSEDCMSMSEDTCDSVYSG